MASDPLVVLDNFYKQNCFFLILFAYRPTARVTNTVPAGTRSPSRTTLVARGPVLKIALR